MSRRASKLKLLTLSSYNTHYSKDPTAALYVINRSAKGSHGMGNVAFSALDEFSKPTSVMVPVTAIPYDLTQIVPRNNLLASSRFKQLLAQGYLSIVDNKEAEDYLRNDPHAAAEYERLMGARFEGEDSLDMEIVTEAAPTTQTPENVNVSDNPFVESIITRSRGEINEDELISALRNQVHALEVEDLELIAANVTQSAVKEFCLDEARALKELEDEEA